MKKEEKEQLYLMTCYFCDWMDGENTAINWDTFDKATINKLQKQLRLKVRGY